MHPIVEKLLETRGVPPEGRAPFLAPDFVAHTHSPELFSSMPKAVERLWRALERGERVVVHGDYDADGLSGTTLLVDAMEQVARAAKLTPRLSAFLPDREADGYGMQTHTVERLVGEGAQVIVTVDNGIACIEPIARAVALGADVIVVDHHQLAPTLPVGATLIHPLVPGETYPFPSLCGTGVAYKVASALFAFARARGVPLPPGQEKWLLDLVAIATITDMVPLVGENRVLEHFGLKVLNRTRRPGLLALMQVAGVEVGSLTEEDIGFRLGPRLNAAGRMSHANDAYAVLTAVGNEAAQGAAAHVQALNAHRQKETEAAVREAKKQLDTAGAGQPFIAFVSDTLRVGIAGLVAGKLCEATGKPAVAMARVGEKYVGSGRAPTWFNFVEAMNTCREHMLAGGGHPQACGFTLAPESIEPWLAAMRQVAGAFPQAQAASAPVPTAHDAELALVDIGIELAQAIALLAPFGVGNPEPVFLTRGVQVLARERIGKTQTHIRLTVSDGVRAMPFTGFSLAEATEGIGFGSVVDLYYTLSLRTWRGSTQVQGLLKAVRAT
jgi:single-stranded-DNA-specific exonuclease